MVAAGLDACATPIGVQQSNGINEVNCVASTGLPLAVWVGAVLAICVIALFLIWLLWPKTTLIYRMPDIEDEERLR